MTVNAATSSTDAASPTADAASPAADTASPAADAASPAADGTGSGTSDTNFLGGIYEGVPAGGPSEPLQLIDEGAPAPDNAAAISAQERDLTYRTLVLGLSE